MADKPLDESITESAAAGPKRFREVLEAMNAATEPMSAASALRDAMDAAGLSDTTAAALSATVGDPLDVTRRSGAETPIYLAPGSYSLPERYGERRMADISSDPGQSAVQLARLLTAVDPGQLATALRRIADAIIDALASTPKEEPNDDR